MEVLCQQKKKMVLNLIINGLPSKLRWYDRKRNRIGGVLNLIINGLPSKHAVRVALEKSGFLVLNLIINGLPSKQRKQRKLDY